MWSGPRNISTALMRAWENRSDTVVCDEPLYSYYLRTTGLPHPGAEEIIEHHESDWRSVVEWLTGPTPNDARVFYQKHMAHHLLPEVDRSWLDQMANVFLIRDPEEMLTSLAKVIPRPRLEDTGLPQQVEIFRRVAERSDSIPPVLDGRSVLEDPAGQLRSLCAKLDLEFSDAMLAWPTGPRATDGIWARHWYDAVERSTGFKPYAAKPDRVPDDLIDVLRDCEPLYAELAAHRM